jgi:serine/threonine-protein kinase HipA
MVVEPWLDNLLPDSDHVRVRWALGMSLARPDVFDILVEAGEDCPGAVQLLEAGRVPDQSAGRTPLSESEVASRIRGLREAGTDWAPDPSGHWSLGGAQPKFALGWDESGWYSPTGREPSTHIVKIGFAGMLDSDWAEHVTSRIAAKLGLAVAHTQVLGFEAERALVVRRFDRLPQGRTVLRLHQEDCCQALGLWRQMKYESDGGPGLAAVAGLLEDAIDPRSLEQAKKQFAQAILFNWVAACPDAHAKNYALLHLGAAPRLAPLFDLASAALLWSPAEVEFSGRMAMSMGGEDRLFSIRTSHLESAAKELRVPQDWFLAEAGRQLQGLLPALEECLAEAEDMPPDTAARFRSGMEARVRGIRRYMTLD